MRRSRGAVWIVALTCTLGPETAARVGTAAWAGSRAWSSAEATRGPASADGGDYAAEFERVAAAVVPEAEDLAKWCNRKKLYATRDDVYAMILALDTDHPVARKGLRFLKQRGGGWKQSDQYRRPSDRNDEALEEFAERRAAVFAPFTSFGFEWLAKGEEALSLAEAQALAAGLILIVPEGTSGRERLGAIWDLGAGTWPVEAPSRSEVTAASELSGTPAPASATFPSLALEVQLDALGIPLFVDEDTGPYEGYWFGRSGASDLFVGLVHYEVGDGTVAESEDVADRWLDEVKSGGRTLWPGVAVSTSERIPDPDGQLGAGSYAILARGAARPRSDRPGAAETYVVAGLLPTGGWSLVVECSPPLPKGEGEKLARSLRSAVRYRGEQRDPRWTDEEAQARWASWAPEGLEEEMDEVVRTEHFIVLGNSNGGKKFGQKMEECYETIQEMFPFEEVEGRRLLPVFLFRTREQYNEFLVKNVGFTIQEARRSGGVAWADLYSTWYEAPADPVHIHEATHQLFRNRLRLGRGGSWLQEGLAEYVETRENQRSGAARDVRKRRHMPLREFFAVRSLLFSTEEGVKGGNAAGDQYKLAAVFVEFLRESDFCKDTFPAFLADAGRLPYNDVDRIEAAIRTHFGCSIEELEDAFVEYCSKR